MCSDRIMWPRGQKFDTVVYSPTIDSIAGFPAQLPPQKYIFIFITFETKLYHSQKTFLNKVKIHSYLFRVSLC
jgi:hypothetical protein